MPLPPVTTPNLLQALAASERGARDLKLDPVHRTLCAMSAQATRAELERRDVKIS